MPLPNNYSIALPPTAGMMTGVQNALQIAQGMESADAEKARGDLYRVQAAGAQAELDAKKRAADAAAMFKADLDALTKAPTSEGITALMLKYPHMGEQLKRPLDALNEEERKVRVGEAMQVYAATVNDQPDVAIKMLEEKAGALREKGDTRQASMYELMAKTLRVNPNAAQTTIGMMLSEAMGPDKFKETFKELEDQRRLRSTEGDKKREAAAGASKAESEAASAAVAARYAESNAAADLAKKGWDITKLQNDIEIAKQNAKIAAASLALQRANTDIERQKLQLQVDKMKDERDKVTRERAAEATGQYQIVNEVKSLVTDILAEDNRPALKGATGLTAWTAAVPGTPERTLAGKIERLSTLLTVDNLKLMSGVLTDKDIQVLRQVGGNFDRWRASKDVIAELQRVDNALVGARAKLEQKYGPEPKAPAGAAANTDSDW